MSCSPHFVAIGLIYYTSIKRQERSYFRQLLFCNPVQGLCYLSLHAYQIIILAVKTSPSPFFFGIFFTTAKLQQSIDYTKSFEEKIIFLTKKFGSSEKGCIFAIANEGGSVVQLVRIHACHAWGREFESRPDRQQKGRVLRVKSWNFSFLYIFSSHTNSFQLNVLLELGNKCDKPKRVGCKLQG